VHILICSPEHNEATGNWVTANRYRRGLEAMGHRVTLCHVSPTAHGAVEHSLLAVVQRVQPDLLLLLHAYRLGRLWLEQRAKILCPVLVMLSGTDINEGLQNPEQVGVIEEVLQRADGLISHNELTVATLKQSYPDVATRLHYLPAAIELGEGAYPLRQKLNIAESCVLFLCPASIRPIKGVLQLIELFDQLPVDHDSWQLAFCGPELDDQYGHHFHRAVDERDWVHYLGVIAPDAMPAVMKQADVIVNNSISEGLPNALIEASVLGRPILANDILGNRPLVDHGVNGFLYADKNQFCQFAAMMIHDTKRREQLSQPRPERYHVDREREELNRICCMIYRAAKGSE